MNELLKNVKLTQKTANSNSYMFVFPNGDRKNASMTDVLLWRLSQQLEEINSNLRDIEHNTDETS